MRVLPAAMLAVVAFCLAGMPILAQSPAAPPADNTVVLSDPDKDVVLSAGSRVGVPAQNGSCPAPNTCQENFDHIDILRVTFGQETTADFRVSMQVKSLSSNNAVGYYRRYVTFT